MSKKKEKSIGSYLGESIKETCYFLTILFCVLRACGIITWSWFWIMAPIFISWVIGFVMLAVAGIITLAVIKEEDD